MKWRAPHEETSALLLLLLVLLVRERERERTSCVRSIDRSKWRRSIDPADAYRPILEAGMPCVCHGGGGGGGMDLWSRGERGSWDVMLRVRFG